MKNEEEEEEEDLELRMRMEETETKTKKREIKSENKQFCQLWWRLCLHKLLPVDHGVQKRKSVSKLVQKMSGI